MSVKNKNVLVLGGSGFIGTNTIIRLKEKGAIITNVDIRQPKVDVHTIIDDLATTDFAFLDEKKWDYIFMLAAKSNVRLCDENPAMTFNINVMALFALLQKITDKKIKPQKIIFNSSTVIYDDTKAPLPSPENSPMNYQSDLYSLTKGIDEEICKWFIKEHSLPIFYFRPSHVYGPYQDWEPQFHPNIIAQIITQGLLKKEITLWNRVTSRDFLYVDDLVDAYLLAMDSDFVGTMNFGYGDATSIAKVAELVARFTNGQIIDLKKPAHPPLKIQLDNSLASKTLGWKPRTGIEDGLRRTIEYYKKVVRK